MASLKGYKDDPKTIFGWSMYDWANSAYITTAVGLLPIYFTRTVVGPEGVRIGGTLYAADTLWAFAVGAAGLVVFLLAPILGSLADFSAAKKRFLLSFAFTGSLFTLLLYFSVSGDVLRTLFFFLVAQISFIGANVFYDAFLPQIASSGQMDRVSARGYAFGYVGGGLQFGLALLLIAGHEWAGISQQQAARIGIASAGLWWAGFTLFTAHYLREPPTAAQAMPERFSHWPRWAGYLGVGVWRPLRTAGRVRRFRHLLLFLIAFMLYDDGIQTVINMATAYGAVELNLPTWVLMVTLLVIQFIATGGALLFSRIAGRLGTKPTIMLTLAIWSGVVVYAYFLRSAAEFFGLGVLVGLVLGGSQALSRSFYGSIVPEEASAEFFAFYTVFTKFSSIWGPWVFGLMKQWTGSSRQALLSIIVFFIVGLFLLSRVDVEKAQEAKREGAF